MVVLAHFLQRFANMLALLTSSLFHFFGGSRRQVGRIIAASLDFSMIQGSNLMLESFKVHARQVTFQAFFTEELHSRSGYSSYEAIDFLRNLLVCYKSIIMNHFY